MVTQLILCPKFSFLSCFSCFTNLELTQLAAEQTSVSHTIIPLCERWLEYKKKIAKY